MAAWSLTAAEAAWSGDSSVLDENLTTVLRGLPAPPGAPAGMWLPLLSASRPVLPLERLCFRGSRPSSAAALELCQELGLTLVSCHQAGGVGTALQIERISALPEGGLAVDVVATSVLRLGETGTVLRRRASGEVQMVNVVSVVPVEEFPAARGGDLREARRTELRRKVTALLSQVRPASALSDPPRKTDDFSWWAAARLPLPAGARAPLLEVAGSEERLSLCAAVLSRFVSAPGALPGVPGVGRLRAKL
ncbi:unnamed protein product [Polarella glacialis]|uniref:Lon N-terminal domain-containing protein n=1 Tax=Polarella glacialis TaxID=89957 RepID=A0A813GR77_POLGL|nr:unnamed protein product [Polarella glacialis]